jgi:wyosine [tRNA(Phe)-imidazoG37] synthetase (radical SAM superfamily)
VSSKSIIWILRGKKLTYTYGPVSSWRYGRSLGVDVTTPPKKCTYNCIYCQLGPTKCHVALPDDIQKDMPFSDDIVSEVEIALSQLEVDTVDVLTFSGTGEPTLNLSLGSVVTEIRKYSNNLPIILLTNASLFPRNDVQENVSKFDIVTAKFDAGDSDTFTQINRPSKNSFKFHEIRMAIKKLGETFSGILALEVMLLRGPGGLTNVEGKSRKCLIDGIVELDPDLVQIYTPWRPTAVFNARPVPMSVLQEFGNELEEYLEPEKLWVYGIHDARGKAVVWKKHHILEDEVLKLLSRRPCRVTDVVLSLGIIPAIAKKTLENLLKEKKIAKEQTGEDVFYKAVA